MAPNSWWLYQVSLEVLDAADDGHVTARAVSIPLTFDSCLLGMPTRSHEAFTGGVAGKPRILACFRGLDHGRDIGKRLPGEWEGCILAWIVPTTCELPNFID